MSGLAESAIAQIVEAAHRANDATRISLCRCAKEIFEGRLRRGETGEQLSVDDNIDRAREIAQPLVRVLVAGLTGRDPVQEKADELRREYALREQAFAQLKGHDLYTLIQKFMDPNKSLRQILEEYPKTQVLGYYVPRKLSQTPNYIPCYTSTKKSQEAEDKEKTA